jgi:4-diphosphocytidyl-2-C-methyl-D-erythritol kinase
VRLAVRCNAKVNLFLSVAPKDARGYHPIRTIFQAIGLSDTLTIETGAAETRIECDWEGLPEQNTLTKTLGFLQEVASVPPLAIRLEKRIPAESGLGGGSSDAAGLLRALSQAMPGAIADPELMRIAAAVGADVPFFLVGGLAKGEGYGERLAPLPDAPREWLLVLKPEEGAGTREMYAALDRIAYPWRDFPTGDELYNDFERVARPGSLSLIERLTAAGARDAGLTGSGSVVFGRFPSEAAAREAEARVAQLSQRRMWVVPTMTREESLRIERIS